MRVRLNSVLKKKRSINHLFERYKVLTLWPISLSLQLKVLFQWGSMHINFKLDPRSNPQTKISINVKQNKTNTIQFKGKLVIWIRGFSGTALPDSRFWVHNNTVSCSFRYNFFFNRLGVQAGQSSKEIGL